MLSAKEAQVLREQHKDARAHLNFLKSEGKPADRAGVMAYNKALKAAEQVVAELDAQLKNAPPPPFTPDETWMHITDVFDRQLESAQKDIAKFHNEAAKSLKYATEWYIADAIKAETKIQSMYWFGKIAEAEGRTTEQRLELFIERYQMWLNDIKEKILQRARGMMSRSTSTASNFAEDCAAEAFGYILYEFTESSSCWQVKRALDRYQVWKELRNA